MSERQQHWEQVYHDKASTEVSWYQSSPRQSLQMITAVAGKESAIIDVGGGASLLVDTLQQQGYHRLAVLDISATALACARERVGDKAQQVEWYVADVTTFAPPHRFDVWHDRAVFHFLTSDADRNKYLAVLREALEPGAHLIIATFAEDGPERCSGLPVERYGSEKIAQVFADGFTLLEQQSEAHTTPSGAVQRFNYFLFRYSG